MRTTTLAMVVSVALGSWTADAQPPSPHVVGHLQGYICMALNLSHEQLMDFDNAPPVMAEPSARSSRIGVASASVIVAEPRRLVNGYVQMLHMDGRPGWIEANKVKPWVNVSNPSTRCTPAMMSNGRPGFDYSRPQR